jgi:hypothetical protein
MNLKLILRTLGVQVVALAGQKIGVIVRLGALFDVLE